jgi:hypothetical protein
VTHVDDGVLQIEDITPMGAALPSILSNPALRDAVCRWIERVVWTGHLTLEWHSRPTPESAARAIRVFFCMVNRSMLGRKWPQRPGSCCVAWIAILELRSYKVPHAHILIVCNASRDVLQTAVDSARKWWAARIGFTHYGAIRSRQRACRYVANHFSRDTGIECSDNLGCWLDPT